MQFAGIDPGRNGVVSIYEDGRIVDDLDLKKCPVRELGGGKYLVLPVSWFAQYAGIKCLVEGVSGNGGVYGVNAAHIAPRMFQFGAYAGGVYSMALSSGWDVKFILPVSWRAKLQLKGASDAVVAKRARQLIPSLPPGLRHDQIESALFAFLASKTDWSEPVEEEPIAIPTYQPSGW